MSRVTEITALFAKLASRLQTGLPSTTNEEPLVPVISSLNQSLNQNETPRVRVLNTALSLMCFKAPQVFDSMIEYLVETIASVLSSSISCKVIRFQRVEFLHIGSSISSYDCMDLIRECLDVFERLEGHGMLSHLLLRAVLRVTVSASYYQYLFPSTLVLGVQSSYQKDTAISKLQHLLPEEISVNSEIPLRLFLWYLDPLALKHDILKILRESMQRPFLCMNRELHERLSWRSIILCLILSPTAFIEIRTLLHKWFLVTGLASILELQIELVSSVLDVLAQPMRWGISSELGPNLPFSYAYFPYKHDLLATLVGPLSCESFLGLVHLIRRPVYHAEKHSYPIFRQSSTQARMISHNSTWAMLMAFPSWFFFAAALLFSGKNWQDILLSNCTSDTTKTEQSHDEKHYCTAAAQYLAFILSPVCEAHSDLLVECLMTISGSWTLKQYCSDTLNDTAGCRKKLRKPKLHDKEDKMASKEYDVQAMRIWLKEFHDLHKGYLSKTFNSYVSTEAKAWNLRQNLLFRRIPLGILIGCSNIDEEGFELLLHYAATGKIIHPMENQNAKLKRAKQKPEEHYCDENAMAFSEEYDERVQAIAGVHLLFNLFDVIEDMSASVFETEESGLNFICQLKMKAARFLVKYIGKLLHFKIGEDEDDGAMMMLMDLHKRLTQWRHQVQEIVQGYKVLDDVVSTLDCKLSSL